MKRNKDIDVLYMNDQILSESLIKGNLGIFRLLKEYIIKELLPKLNKKQRFDALFYLLRSFWHIKDDIKTKHH